MQEGITDTAWNVWCAVKLATGPWGERTLSDQGPREAGMLWSKVCLDVFRKVKDTCPYSSSPE